MENEQDPPPAKSAGAEDPPPIVRMEAPLEEPPNDPEAQAQAEQELDLLEAQEKSKQLRPLYANRVYVEPFGKTLRISFGERIGGEQIFHTAVVMTFEDALETGDLITRLATANLGAMWDQIRQAIEAEKAAEAEPNG